jgi:hypothetical protein
MQEIEKIIFTALDSVNQEREEGTKFAITADTALFGIEGVLDSLELVSLIVDVETFIADSTGNNISLTDDRAMSQATYPFSNVHLLTSYIQKLLAEN